MNIRRLLGSSAGEHRPVDVERIINILNLVGSILFLTAAILTFVVPRSAPPTPERELGAPAPGGSP